MAKPLLTLLITMLLQLVSVQAVAAAGEGGGGFSNSASKRGLNGHSQHLWPVRAASRI